MSKKLPESDDALTAFLGVSKDLKPVGQRKIEDELFKKWQAAAVDNFEQKLGIVKTEEAEGAKNIQSKTKMFQMEYDKDKQLFEELINSPKYKIIYWDKTWTMDGNSRIFAVYEDNLDYKPTKK